MKKMAVLLAIMVLLSSGQLFSKGRKVKGYITEINSEKSVVEIWRNRIAVPRNVQFEIKDNERNLQLDHNDLRVGMHIEVKGDYSKNKYQLTAKKISIDADQFEKEIKRTAYLYREIEGLERNPDGWVGTIFLDGQKVEIQPTTEVLFKLNRKEKKQEKKVEKLEKKDEDDIDEEDLEEIASFDPLKYLNEVRPGDFCEYTGFRNEDGSITATRLVFQKNDLENDEQKLFKKLELKEKEFDEEKAKNGQLKVGGSKFKTYYSQALQEYFRDQGKNLVPDYQRSLIDGDPRKIDFRFYVIDGQKGPNAFAFPNGIIGINTAMLLMLENEAQLAFVLGHEIAHAINEHTHRQQMFHSKKRMALGIASIATSVFGWGAVTDILTLTQASITNGYSRFLEDQADRYGLTFAADLGYNPLQSVQVWVNMERNFGGSSTNFFWSSHSSNSERISYLLLEMRNNFPNQTTEDFTKMTLGTERYLAETEVLRNDPKLEKLRKRMEKYREKYKKEEGSLKF